MGGRTREAYERHMAGVDRIVAAMKVREELQDRERCFAQIDAWLKGRMVLLDVIPVAGRLP